MRVLLELMTSLTLLSNFTASEKVLHLAEKSVKLAEQPVITRKVVFGDRSFDVGDRVVGSLYVQGSGQIIQSYIDRGLVAQGWNELDNSDGMVTYLAGHNPGVLSDFANWVEVGKTITVYDSTGNAKSYRMNRVMETPMNRPVNGVSSEVIDYTYYHMYDHEGLVIQFCKDNSVMQLWIAEPV